MLQESKWSGREFYTSSGQYLDRARSPIFRTENSLYNLREEVLTLRPKGYDKIFMPFVEDASVFWLNGVSSGCLNSNYAPYTVLLYVIKYHLPDFIAMVDGTIIDSEKAYNQLLNAYNHIYTKVVNGNGGGTIYGYCSVDEMIRIGSLFYQVMLSGDFTHGISLDEERRIDNNWNKRKKIFDIDHKTFDQYRRKLEGSFFSDMDWLQFCFRYTNTTDENTFWLFNIPKEKTDESSQVWYKDQDLIPLLDLSERIVARGGKVLFIVPKTTGMIEKLSKVFRLVYMGDSIWKSMSHNFYLRDNLKEDYLVISSYRI